MKDNAFRRSDGYDERAMCLRSANGGNFMTQEKIARINELAAKSRTQEGLNEQEQQEQAILRREYIDAMKHSLKTQLDRTVIVNSDGTRTKLAKK